VFALMQSSSKSGVCICTIIPVGGSGRSSPFPAIDLQTLSGLCLIERGIGQGYHASRKVALVVCQSSYIACRTQFEARGPLAGKS